MYFPTLAIVSAILISAVTVAAEPKTVDVVMTESGLIPRFNPTTVDINVGDTVRWTNKGWLPHTIDEGKSCLSLLGKQTFKSGIVLPGTSYSYTFNKAGEYSYFCMPHCAIGTMKGTISVKESPAPASET